MIRERALKVLLVLSGLACLAGPYPLTGALRDGPATTINRQDQMILGIYISLGVFLLIAARNPRQHRSLILFAGWSTLTHDGVMIVQGIQFHDLRSDLLFLLVSLSIVPRFESPLHLNSLPRGVNDQGWRHSPVCVRADIGFFIN